MRQAFPVFLLDNGPFPSLRVRIYGQNFKYLVKMPEKMEKVNIVSKYEQERGKPIPSKLHSKT